LLQDQLPPFDNAIAFWLIQTELDRPVSQVAKYPQSLSPPAWEYTGTPAQRRSRSKGATPQLATRADTDLYLMRWVWMALGFPLNLGHDLTLIVDEFGTVI